MKKILLILAAGVFALGSNAQIAFEKSNVLDNIYVGAQAGVATNMQFNHTFPFNATAGLHVGKLLSPVVGAELEGSVWFGDNNRDHSNTFVKGVNVGANGTINFSNLIWGYDVRRVELIGVAGLGWLHMYQNGSHGYEGDNLDYLTAKTGVRVGINLNDAHRFYVEPAVNWCLTGHEHGVEFNKNYAQVGIQVGYSYHFGNSNGTHRFKTYDIAAMNVEINALRAALAEKPTEVIKSVEVPVEKIVTKTVTVRDTVRETANAYVFFAKNSYELSNEAIKVLNNVSGCVTVEGYASPEGSEEYNYNLSCDRANEVADYLRSRGVKVKNVRAYGANTNTSNRVVIISK